MKKIFFVLLPLTLLIHTMSRAQQRIVSLNAAISEMLCSLGLESQIAGVDVTSNYPASLRQKTSVGHNRNISAEGILALRPTLILGVKDELRPEVLEQLRSANVKVQLIPQVFSTEGTRAMLTEIAKITNTVEQGKQLLSKFDKEMAALKIPPTNKKVLFVYARGAGSMTVCGTGQSPDQMIRLAGASNAMTDFKDFKPLSAEAVVAANPDVILLFDSGLQSVGGVDGLLKVPGVSNTNAGKNRKIISMDGQFLTGFGLRLPQAIEQLHKKIIG